MFRVDISTTAGISDISTTLDSFQYSRDADMSGRKDELFSLISFNLSERDVTPFIQFRFIARDNIMQRFIKLKVK